MRFRLTFSLCGALVLIAAFAALLAVLPLVAGPTGFAQSLQKATTFFLYIGILFPADMLADVLYLPKPATPFPNTIAILAVCFIEAFVILFAISFVVTAFKRR